jgi:peptidoglycan-N-acetylglucosamine deacetylase
MRYFLGWFFALFSIISWAAAEDTPAASSSPSPSPASSPEAPTGAAKPATWFSVNVDGPYIAMTFDDGPSPATTPQLLDILKQRNIKATFFMIGQNAQANPNIVKRILAEGHEIGNHSWTHPQLSKLSDERVTEEITKTQDAIKNACGYTPVLLRPPYGAITARQKEWIEKHFGLSVIIWSVDPFDWKRPGSSVIEQRILAGARPGAIVLSHDIHKQTVEAMPATLDALAAKGFKFVTVSQLIAMNKPKSSATPSPQSKPSASPRSSPSKKHSKLAVQNAGNAVSAGNAVN